MVTVEGQSELLTGLHKPTTFQLVRLQFVPAHKPDTIDLPFDVDLIVLKGSGKVSQHPDRVLGFHRGGIVSAEYLLFGITQGVTMPGLKTTSAVTAKALVSDLYREEDVALQWKSVRKAVRLASHVARQHFACYRNY